MKNKNYQKWQKMAQVSTEEMEVTQKKLSRKIQMGFWGNL